MEKKRRRNKLSAFILTVALLLCSTRLFMAAMPEPPVGASTNMSLQAVPVIGFQQMLPVAVSTSPSSLSVSTDTAYYDSNGYIYASGQVSSTLSVERRGFVYSRSTSSPSLSSGSIHNQGSGSGSFNGSFYVNDEYDYYYVRAYATDSNGTTEYGGTIQVYISDSGGYGRPSVSTVSVSNVYGRGADVAIRVSDGGNSRITDRGVVYSSSYSTPTLNNSSDRSVSGTTGTTTVSLSGLSTNTKYYVRAYATNSYGTSYGQVRTFTTDSSGSGSDSTIRTTEVIDIKATTATAYGYVYDEYNGSIRERGFVYSASRSTPTTGDSKVYDTVNSQGRYSYSLSGLTGGTTYYLRAYLRTQSSTYYGEVIKFTTGSTDNHSISITYKTLNGVTAGSQTLSSQTNRILTPALLGIPAGYTIYDSGWTYTVQSDASITVLVAEAARPVPTPTPTPTPMPGPASPRVETTFMPGVGNYEFKPEEAVTRGEAAQIIYNLSDKIMGGNPIRFGDVENGTYKLAVDYVSSKGYMVGYPEGVFKPESKITRAEMAVILCNFYELKGSAKSDFSDLSQGYWGYNFISLATQAGMISGYEDGTYRPSQYNTRAEACVLFSRAEKRSLVPISGFDFSDVPKTHWAYDYIMNAALPSR